jgi:hypothetical protein
LVEKAFGVLSVAAVALVPLPWLTSPGVGLYATYTQCDFDCRVDRVLAQTVPPPDPLVDAPFVSRPTIEALIRPVIGTPQHTYTIVAGAHGTGKSRLVRELAMNLTGVVAVSYSDADFVGTSIGGLILADMTKSREHETSPAHVLTAVCKQASERRRLKDRSKPTWVPTIIIELRSDIENQGGVKAIAGIAKELGVDSHGLSVIVVLNDADAIFGLPDDTDRQNVIWVDDFSDGEAHSFLDELGALPLNKRFDANGTDMNASLRQRVFEFVGTRAVDLVGLVDSLKIVAVDAIDDHVEAWIGKELFDAQLTIGRMFALADHRGDFDLRIVVDALLKSRDQTIRSDELPGLLKEPKVVSEILKARHALLYHFPTATYRFHSRAFFHAAMRLHAE